MGVEPLTFPTLQSGCSIHLSYAVQYQVHLKGVEPLTS